ncbi:MAG: NifB/NifX family molybdenum-iron cluster-binding protein [Anaerolineae bacterium]|nr:NifB/NifX family molybdenum-iron cluster-binding protein [Anaerolineae bacterium]
MRIAISADTSDGLNSRVAQHFGRCPFFAIVEVEGKEVQSVELIDNPFFASHQPGQVPGFIHEQKANVMISGGMGRRAIDIFQQVGIEAVTGASGSVQNALDCYFDGVISGTAPCKESEDHHAHGHHH